MDPNRAGHDNAPLQSSRQIFLPAHLTQYDRDTGSISSEDPLATQPSTRSQSPAKGQVAQDNPLSTALSPSGASRIVVVLGASPERPRQFGTEVNHKEVRRPVVSGLTPSGAHLKLPSGPSEVGALANLSPSNQGGASSGTYRGRGRPKGWRPTRPYNVQPRTLPATAASSRQTRPVKPRPHPNGFPKRRGRPPKAPSPQPEELYRKLKAPFIAFLCEWQGCKAELHNLDTLRRHVYIVHGYDATCGWASCAKKDAPRSFDNDEEFKAHIEEAHLVPFAWHVGDGPQNSSGADAKQEEDIPDFLKDESGHQVTPSIKNQQVEDLFTWRNNRRRLKELIMRRDENLPSDDSDQAIAGVDTQ
ncbi:hypothetical protein B0T10DRAFT_476886 [Thelonectria olida]|uniref:C2H2-type domain-containing protein n=1 Tax=Thelonectria olida TaxID=1576542 RepID=A0A9P9AV91_9HYPO|nr:hypothetical protein B0T10DRAFT_476886 [Thelonectria olida]